MSRQLPDEPVKEKTGFELNDLAKVPFRPPELKEEPHPTTRQWRLTMIGMGLVLVSVIVWPLFGTTAMLAVLVLAAACIAVGVLLRL